MRENHAICVRVGNPDRGPRFIHNGYDLFPTRKLVDKLIKKIAIINVTEN